MSYIPPLVCDTPPPIDFEDSHEDDFGDGMFSNYDGSSLPTTPKQLSSINDHDDLPLDIPELPDEQHFPDRAEKELQTKASLECTELPSTNSSILHTNHIYCEPPELPSVIIENEVDSNEVPKIEQVEIATHQSDVGSNQPVNEPSKLTNSVQSLDNSSASQSNDNVCRSDSPPSLVFSAESINCDDNQCDDFDEFHQHTDDVECNFPSLKLDSISDTKSQSSDLDETTNMPECEIDEVRDNTATTNAGSSRLESEFAKTIDAQSSNVEDVDVTVTNADDSFDDFVEYESSVAQPDKSDFVECEVVTAATSIDECAQSKEANDENVFAADFSQFEVYTENATNKPDEPISTEQHKSYVSTLDQLPTERVPTSTAATDDFGDFENADDDDDFGEFNDFSDFTQSQSLHSPLTANVEELTARIKPLLDSLFPTSDNESEDGSYDGPVLTNDTTKIIKDFENSKALDHQWTTSVGKSSLVTALGIDSRNILYGGKWNSSMPRFAANLGFSPLEPMKPSNVSGPSSSVTNEIPAAQFDWNSSGLTNPLDASHAHTLLLDLEQLVVVANLDKIKLDSSTCSSTNPATASKPTTNNNTMSSLNNHYIHNCNGDDDDGGVGYQYNGDFYGNSLPYSCETNIKTLEKNVNHFGLFDQFLDIRVQEILHKTNTAENQSSRAAHDWHSTKAEPTLIAPTVPAADIMHTTLKNVNTTNFIDSVIDSEESTQVTASYVVPGSGSLKETHIFTPSKSPYSIPQSREVSNDKPEPKCPDFDYEKAAAGIIIDENVVKKEYRDVEYDPDKPTASTLSNSDDFSDFQSVPIPLNIPSTHKPQQNTLPMDFGILQPTKRNDNITINWPDPGNVATATDMDSFDSFRSAEHIGSGSTSDFAATNEGPKSSSSSFGDFAKPVIGVSPSEIMFETNSTAVEDDFSDFQSVEPIPSHNNVADVISKYRVPPLSDVIPSNKIEPLSKKTDSDSIITSEFNASNWTDFQSTKVNDAPMQPSVPSTNILQPAPLKPVQILTPQPVNPQPNLQPSSIWPESEIDPDEIARLEAIFPQAQKQSLQPETKPQNPNTSKSQEDDEWSDFVSVPTPAAAPQPLPITNIISRNIAKHQQDDDEWSDFVSSTSQPSSMQQWNVSSGPNFTSWNAPPQFDSWQSSTLFQQPQQFASTLPPSGNPSLISNQPNKANPNSFFTQKAPSISLIPDLSFVAPKTLVNRSRTNYQSK
ncbi:uncharacterized protein LOC119067263 [Bradysia coprophila]|uniref:uncharacterized protein LOC119067263 n=1 Tax=Bradysia coprophila TaxID=38358 RepID=UPI00187D7B63|nr:uncharacterized protein LOC119067263 [Bradysia coprophila]